MPKKKRNRGRGSQHGTGAGRDGTTQRRAVTTVGKGSHKEEARERRARLQRSLARRRRGRRVLAWGSAGLVVALAAAFIVTQNKQQNELRSRSDRLASEAGCGGVSDMPDEGGGHLVPGETKTYDQQPPTSGIHAPSPLPPDPRVYDAPVDETAAVHNLEHGYVLIYYRADGPEALPSAVVEGLSSFASANPKVIMAPYPSLAPGRAFALAAWDELQQCPSSVTPAQATDLARVFVDMFRSGGRAPEASVP